MESQAADSEQLQSMHEVALAAKTAELAAAVELHAATNEILNLQRLL